MITTDRLDNVWTDLDFPVLVETVRRLNSGENHVLSRAIAGALDRAEPDVVAALIRLNTRYLDVKVERAWGGKVALCQVTGVTEEGLREVGVWPSPEVAADRLIAALDALIDTTTDGSPKQSRLKAARDGLLATGREVLVEVAGAAITGRLPLG